MEEMQSWHHRIFESFLQAQMVYYHPFALRVRF